MLGKLGASQYLVVDIWSMLPYGLAVLRSYASNSGQFYLLGGVNTPVNSHTSIAHTPKYLSTHM